MNKNNDNQIAGVPKGKLAKAQNHLVDFLQIVTGAAVSDKKDAIRDISHLVQRGIQWRLASGFTEELNALKIRGQIKEDYETTDQCRQQTSYVFDAIKSDGPIDEKRFWAMKNIFLNAAQEKMSDRNQMLPIILMQLCSTLNEAELLVLEAASRLRAEDSQPRYDTNNAGSWLSLIAEESGLGLPDLVEQCETSLMQKGLLTKRTAGGNILVNKDHHLSGTGIKLCEFIKAYEPVPEK